MCKTDIIWSDATHYAFWSQMLCKKILCPHSLSLLGGPKVAFLVPASLQSIYLMCCLMPIFTIIEWLAFQGLTHFLPAFLSAFLFAVVGYFCDLKNLRFCCGLIEAVALGSDPGTMGAYTGAGEGSTLGSTFGQQISSLKEIISAKSFQMCSWVLFPFLLFSWMYWCHFISTQELVSTAPSMDHSLELQCHSVRSLCVCGVFWFLFSNLKITVFYFCDPPFPFAICS